MATSEELDFGSKLIDSLNAIEKKKNSSYKWNIGLSVVLIFLSADVMSIDNKVSIQWINLTIDSYSLIILLSIFLFLSHQRCASLLYESVILKNRIQSVYESLITDSKIFVPDDFDYLGIRDMLDSLTSEKLFKQQKLGRIYYGLNIVIFLFLVTLLPMVAEIMAFIKLATIFSYNWWLIIGFLILVLFEVIIIISLIKVTINKKVKEI